MAAVVLPTHPPFRVWTRVFGLPGGVVIASVAVAM